MAEVSHGMNLLQLGQHQIQLKYSLLALCRFMKDHLPDLIGATVCL